MSNFLAVDTSSRYLTVVAKKGDKVALRYSEDCAMRHSVMLMDEIERALNEAGLHLEDCDYFAAVTGPGSFTGIRIGISTVKGFATALKKPAYGVTAFDMISYNVNSDSSYLVAIDAAHGNYYVCGYTPLGFSDISPRFVTEEEALSFGRPVYGFEELELDNYRKVNIKECLLSAAEMCERVRDKLDALYVKKSQAEEEREARLNSL